MRLFARSSGAAGLAQWLVLGLLVAGAVRTVLFLVYAAYTIPAPEQAYHLEGVSVHFAWRAQQGLELYPPGDRFPYAVNLMGPVYFWVVGFLGRLLHSDVGGLYQVGRWTTLACSVVSLGVIAWQVRRRYGALAGLAAACFGLGSVPTLGFGLMTRPDMMAECLGVAGLFLSARRGVLATLASAVLLALCVLTKQTAGVYLLAAALATFLEKDRRREAWLLVAASAGLVCTMAGLLAVSSEPNIAAGLLGQGSMPFDLGQGREVLTMLVQWAPDLPYFVLVGAGIWATRGARNPRLLALALIAAAGSLATVTKRGSDLNYFLAWRTVEMLAAGALCHVALRPGAGWHWPLLALAGAAACIWGSEIGLLKTQEAYYRHQLRGAEAGQRHHHQWQRLVSLAEDPQVALLTNYDHLAAYQGQRAAFLDAYLFRLRVEAGQTNPEELVRRIDARQFQYVVLTIDLNAEHHQELIWLLPKAASESLRRNYIFSQRQAGLYVYVPRKS